MTAKTYADKTRTLTAAVVLEDAVADGIRLLRRGPLDDRGTAKIPGLGVGQVTYRYPNDSLARAEAILLAAAHPAEMVLARAEAPR